MQEGAKASSLAIEGNDPMEDLSNRTAQEVLNDHLNPSEHWEAEEGGGQPITEEAIEQAVEEDMRRNVSEEIVILINRGTFRGYEGVRHLARMLIEELPEHCSFEYTYKAVEGRMGFLEWTYEDDNDRVKGE
jgi:hypothetical protein